MKCQDIQLMLPDFVINKLSNGHVGEVQQHITECPQCRATANELQELMVGLRNIQVEEPQETYFATILPRVHERIGVRQKGFQLPAYWLRYVLPVAMILVLATGILNYKKIFVQPTEPATASVPSTEDNFSNELSLILGQLEVSSYDKITTADQEVISDLLSTSDETMALTFDDATSLLTAFSQEDANEFYARLEQQPIRN